MLLVVAGLFIRSMGKAQHVYLGFDPDNLLNVSVDPSEAGYKEERGREFYRELDARLKALPGVVSVSQAFTVPLGYIGAGDLLFVEDHPLEPGKQPPGVSYNFVNMFIGIKPTDPVTYASVGILLVGAALLACWIPARRATRVDPLVALRYE